MKLHKDLREFIELLSSHGVDFVIVGGHAVAFHGYPRFTGDIDILVRPGADNAKKTVSVMLAFGFAPSKELEEILADEERVIKMGRPPNRIDLLKTISGVDFDEAFETSVPAELDGVPVRFLGREQLLKNKRASGRPRDLVDVLEIEKL